MLLFSEHKHASGLFHKLQEEQTRLFFLDIHFWFSGDILYMCENILG